MEEAKQFLPIIGFWSIPIRIPESLRAIGTDGFKICSLWQKIAEDDYSESTRNKVQCNIVMEENALPDVNNIEFA